MLTFLDQEQDDQGYRGFLLQLEAILALHDLEGVRETQRQDAQREVGAVASDTSKDGAKSGDTVEI
jgi:hypothetical protein